MEEMPNAILAAVILGMGKSRDKCRNVKFGFADVEISRTMPAALFRL
jgi:hypothetical protein